MANFVQLDSTERVRGELLLRLEIKDAEMIGQTRSDVQNYCGEKRVF